jgi:predicted SprT family Zn-dependent metalloprotease
MRHNTHKVNNETPYDDIIAEVLTKYKDRHKLKEERITIEFCERLRTTGGWCWYDKKKVWIKLNKSLFEKLNRDEKYELISHEMAHGILFLKGDFEHRHDGEWRVLHKQLGGTGSTHHYFPVKQNMTRRVIICDRRTDTYEAVTLQEWDKIQNKELNEMIFY